jgi:hypothetical protein
VKRFLVAIAGPVFNIVTALAIPTTAILIGFQDSVYRSQEMIVGLVRPGSRRKPPAFTPVIGYSVTERTRVRPGTTSCSMSRCGQMKTSR